jgi:subtilisin family serine protease
MKRLVSIALLLMCAAVFVTAQPKKNWEPVPDSYIVVIKKDRDLKKNFDRGKGRQKKILAHSVHGYLVKMSKEELEETRKNPDVAFIEVDRHIAPNQTAPIWNLDRIDQVNLPLDGVFNSVRDGRGVSVYVIDSGINYSHVDFEGRASFGMDAMGEDGGDCHGHGTHVAGTIGSATYGVAKKVDIYSTRIAGCDGFSYVSSLLQAVDWINANHKKPAVANLSYGLSGISQTLTLAFERGYDYGVIYVVAAGNLNRDSCTYSPSNVLKNIVVGASASTSTDDYRAGFSNWGACVDIFAPGTNILSTYIGSDTAVRAMNGTSMASPMVAGAVAAHLGIRPLDSPDLAQSVLMSESSKDLLINVPAGTYNRFLYTGYGIHPTENYEVCGDTKENETILLGETKEVAFLDVRGNRTLTASVSPQLGLGVLIHLESLKGSNWTAVTSESTSVTHTVKRGRHRWMARSTYGSGAFNFCHN